MLYIALGALNMITCHHLISHKPTCSKQMRTETLSRDSNRHKIKNRNPGPFHPKRTCTGSAYPVLSCSRLLCASATLAARKQATTVFSLHIISHRLFRTFCLLGFSWSSVTTSYSVTLLPVRDWRKMTRVKLRSIHLSNNQQWNHHFQRLNSRESTERKVWNLFNSKGSC